MKSLGLTRLLSHIFLDEDGHRIDPEDISVKRIWIDKNGQEESESIDIYYYNEDDPGRIDWNYDNGLADKDGNHMNEATFRIEAYGYDDPIIIKIKAPKRKTKKNIRFKRKKD